MVETRVRILEEGVELDVPNERPRGALVIESGGRWQARFVLDGHPIAWARAALSRSTFVWAAPAPVDVLGLVPPLRASEVRSTEPKAWPRRFADAIARSARAWLAPGAWAVVPLRPRLERGRTVHVPPGAHPLPSVARGLEDALELPSCFVGRYASAGSGLVIPLRRPTPDAARVRSWRKQAREGTLPPILLGWVGVLDAYVVLDGHDRLLAATLERVRPDGVALFGVREDVRVWPDDVRARAEQESIAAYERVFANEPRLSTETRIAAARRLGEVWSDSMRRRSWTPAVHRPGLAERFERELSERAVPEDVRVALLG